MKCPKVITALWQAFYSPALYFDVCYHWRHRIFGLLAVLCLLTGLSSLIAPVNSIKEFRTASAQIINQLPTLHFDSDCRLSINKPSPYLIKAASGDKLILVFDTLATPKALALHQPLFFSFGHSGFYTYSDASNSKSQPLHTFKPYQDYQRFLTNLTLTPAQLISALSYLMLGMQILIYIASVFSAFVMKLFIGLFFGFIAMAAAFVYRLPLSLGQAFRIAIIALIPSSLLELLYTCLPLAKYSAVNILLSALCFLYVIIIIRSVKKQPRPRKSAL